MAKDEQKPKAETPPPQPKPVIRAETNTFSDNKGLGAKTDPKIENKAKK
jgi:hypothetical protein